MRREPEAWSLLTDGAATLQRSLLNIMWQDDDFEPHKAELLDLLTRFGLLAPLPRKADAWVVPALLPMRSGRPEVPFGWPSRAAATTSATQAATTAMTTSAIKSVRSRPSQVCRESRVRRCYRARAAT